MEIYIILCLIVSFLVGLILGRITYSDKQKEPKTSKPNIKPTPRPPAPAPRHPKLGVGWLGNGCRCLCYVPRISAKDLKKLEKAAKRAGK